MTAVTELWCSRCPAPAETERTVTADNGKTVYTAAYCARCAVNVGWAGQAARKRGKR